MIGVDDRLVTPETMKWVRVGLIAGLATIPTTILLYYALGMAVDSAVEGNNILRSWIAAFVGLVMLKAVLAWIFRTGQFRASSSAKLTVRDQIYKQVVKLGPGILGKRRTGEIANTATEGVEYLDYYFSVYFVQIWIAIAIPIILCAAIFYIDWVVGLWMLAGVPLTPLFVGMAAQGFRRISGSNEKTKNRNFAQYLDSIQGMATLKMFNQDKRRGKQMEDGNELQRKQTMRLLLVAQFQFVFLELGFAMFSTAFAMGVSMYRYSGGFMSAGEAVAVILMSLEFSRTLLLIGEFFFAGALGREVASEVVKFLDEEPPVKSDQGQDPGATNGRPICIEFKNVDFTYPGATEPAIIGLNLSLKPNETVALIGKSGSGKTTVTNLILRTLDTTKGHIFYDDHKDEELSLEWIRQQIALVPQDPFLFFGTIADNLRIAKQDATENEIEQALQAAELWGFVQDSPAGINTMVGDQGTALSGGQAQRLAIARALLKDAPIIILDEPTSQIDVETEALLNRALERLTQNKTVLLIAHRLSTIEQADRIVVMDHGKLVESGNKEQLLANDGIYASMVKTKQRIERTAAAPIA